MNKEGKTYEVSYKTICKHCGWEADEKAISQIRRGELAVCPKCCRLLQDEISDKENRKKVMKFLKNHQLAVIATQNKEGKPESALIAYIEDDNFSLYFQTGTYTRKAKNISQNPHVSLVIGLTLDNMATIQYEGRADLLLDPDSLMACKTRFLEKKSPTTSKHFERPDAVFYKIAPTWIRFSDDTKGQQSSIVVLTGGFENGEISNISSESYSFDHKGQCGNCGIYSIELGPCRICILCDAKMGGEGARLLLQRL